MTASPASAFIDTHALLALVSAHDAHHKRAVAVADALARSGAKLVVSEWVLAEFLSHCARPSMRNEALRAIEIFEAAPDARIVHADHRTFAAALRLYRERDDKSWSLVDCTSMTIARRLRIAHIFTADRHFAQAGFTVLL